MPTPQFSSRSASEWALILPFYLGMVGLAAVFVFWTLTGRFESAFLTTFGSLLLGGQGLRVYEKVREPLPPPPRQRARKTPTKSQRDEA